jgi:CheY-like chemotaxis protein
MDIERTTLPVRQVIETAISGALPAAGAKRIDVVRNIPSTLPPIEGDAKRLQQVLGNILSNAIKFTPEGGRVEIACASDDDMLRIEVTDSGIGISPDFIPFVFDRFRQADSRTTRQHGGLGLGLAIARHLLELHRGSIQARSAGAGLGTTFEIRLPLGSAADKPLAEPMPTLAEDQPLELRLDGATVLIVDDQRDSRDLLSALFDRHGADVVQVGSAVAALDALNSRLVHLLVADLAMPDVDGFELIERVRRTRLHLPAIAVSAYARQEDRHRAFKAGYSAYCAKPLEAAEFLRVIARVLAVSPLPTIH